jgi:hypothetical protein
MNYFYNPIDMDKAKGKQTELKKLSELHQRLETWRRDLPKELEPKEGGLPSMLVMQSVSPIPTLLDDIDILEACSSNSSSSTFSDPS